MSERQLRCRDRERETSERARARLVRGDRENAALRRAARTAVLSAIQVLEVLPARATQAAFFVQLSLPIHYYFFIIYPVSGSRAVNNSGRREERFSPLC